MQPFRALVLLFPLVLWSATHDPVVVVEASPVAIEAEISPLPTGWAFEQEIPGYLGTGYLRWAAPNAYNNPGSGELRYRILITTAGRYVVRLRLNTTRAERTDLNNDVYTRFDDGPWAKTFVGGGSAEGWATRTRLEPTHGKFAEPVYDLSAGLHTFAVSGRSHGLRFDRFVIARDDGTKPSDTMPAATGVPAIPPELTDTHVRTTWLHGGLGAVLKWTSRRPQDPIAITAAQVLNAHVDTRLPQITAWRERDPLIAVDLLEILAAQYQGSERGRELTKLLRTWSSDPQVTKERKARQMAEKVETLLSDYAREKDAQRKAAMATALRNGLTVMRKSCDGTKALADLERRVHAAGVALPE